MKTENQIWKDMMAVVQTGLTYFDISDFEIRQSNQPSKVTIDTPTIWIERVSSKRYGVQSTIPIMVDGQLVEQSSYYQEIIFQITALKKRLVSDDEDSQTAGDVLNLLTTFFNGSVGVRAMAEKSLSSIWITSVNEPAEIMDSELFEKTPSFDITVICKQTETKPINHVEAYEAEVVPV